MAELSTLINMVKHLSMPLQLVSTVLYGVFVLHAAVKVNISSGELIHVNPKLW